MPYSGGFPEGTGTKWIRGRYDFAVDGNVVDVFVGYLRRKLEADGEPRVIQTVRGVGFVLRP